ncbi:MAG: hypothetical protein HY693_00590 [Deltaproteobacteria bacterium]|nr:hypothetical protein [Deltaproteobacteria bacterium]
MDIDKALLDPASVFKTPEEVLTSDELSRKQKIEILRRWEYDARELQVAEEENMIGTNTDMLSDIMRALLRLDEESEIERLEHSPSSKQGGE